jgi:hypothetical protein
MPAEASAQAGAIGTCGDQAPATASFLNPEPSPLEYFGFLKKTAGQPDVFRSARTLLALRAAACRSPVFIMTEKKAIKKL